MNLKPVRAWARATLLTACLLQAAGTDHIKLQNSSGAEAALLVWGAFSSGTSPATFKSSATLVDVGDINGGKPGEVAAFSLDRAPNAKKVTWTNAADTRIVPMRMTVELAVKVWVICPNLSCTALTDAKKDAIELELGIANDLFSAQAAGIVLKLDRATMFHDLSSDRALNKFQTFTNNHSCGDLLKLITGRIDHNALNLYMTKTVDGSSSSGHTCSKPNVAAIGFDASGGLVAHEIGHNHSLDHVNGVSGFTALGPKNIMWKYSSMREFFSEGETYRMHQDLRSVLNEANMPLYSVPLAPASNARFCGNLSPDPSRCPDLDYRPFPD